MISLPLNIIIDPTLKIFILVSSGCYLAKMGILDEKNVKIVSKMIEYLFIPYLMFSYFLESLDIYSISSWLNLIAFSCLFICIGILLALLAKKFIFN